MMQSRADTEGRQRRAGRREAGYSLIELLTVISIMGILVGSALGHYDPRREDISRPRRSQHDDQCGVPRRCRYDHRRALLGRYNGGLENYPRFHENWSGFDLVYRGSFVSLGNPLRVQGAWCGTGGSIASGCNIYNPPRRLWDYDPAFNNAANLPPLTPRFAYVQQVVFTQDFT